MSGFQIFSWINWVIRQPAHENAATIRRWNSVKSRIKTEHQIKAWKVKCCMIPLVDRDRVKSQIRLTCAWFKLSLRYWRRSQAILVLKSNNHPLKSVCVNALFWPPSWQFGLFFLNAVNHELRMMKQKCIDYYGDLNFPYKFGMHIYTIREWKCSMLLYVQLDTKLVLKYFEDCESMDLIMISAVCNVTSPRPTAHSLCDVTTGKSH